MTVADMMRSEGKLEDMQLADEDKVVGRNLMDLEGTKERSLLEDKVLLMVVLSIEELEVHVYQHMVEPKELMQHGVLMASEKRKIPDSSDLTFLIASK